MKKSITLIFILVSHCLFSQETSWEQTQKEMLEKMADSLSKNLKPWKVPNRTFKVEKYGAIGDGSRLNTIAIQEAIDDCSKKGGGVVLFSKGQYVTGTIELKSGVMLKIAEGSRILGSTNLKDYPEKIEAFKSIMSQFYEFRQSLIYAEKCTNIGISGKGEIYFRGEKEHFSSPQTTGKIVGRPLGIRMIECNNVVLEDVFLRNSASWMQNYVYCTNLIFDGIKVENHANYNNDGLDPDGCTNVIIRNCTINAEDDAMCLKGGSGKPCQNVLIENSTFYSTCNALKIGTDTQGPFRNIVCRNLILGGIPDSLISINGHFASSGITLATVDGGNVENILISNVTINQVRCPVFIKIGNRLRVLPEWNIKTPGYLKNIIIENVKGERNTQQGSFISGIKSQSIENIVIRNFEIKMNSVSEAVFAGLLVNKNEKGYPDANNFSIDGLPAHGFFARYSKNISLENVAIKTNEPDARPCFVAGEETENLIANKKTFIPQKLIDFSHDPQLIKNVTLINDSTPVKVLKYRVGTLLYSDKSAVVTQVDSMFAGAEYILWSTNLRSSVVNELLSFDITSPGTLYVAHDPLYNEPEWLTKGFVNTGMKYKMGKFNLALYKKEIDASQKMILGGNHSGDLPIKKGANYLVLFVRK